MRYVVGKVGDDHWDVVTLGGNLERGERLELVVEEGHLKAARPAADDECTEEERKYDYALVSEVVCPGFDFHVGGG